MPLNSRRISDTPLAVIDLETTGLSPDADRVVEMSVVRIDPGQSPRLVLDTLIDPRQRVRCSEIHGIYDEDVVGAPIFSELVGPLAEAIDGAAVASFNVYFDIRFLQSELARAKVPLDVPHLCLMWLRPALGLGKRGTLNVTCKELGISHETEHRAGSDAYASALLWPLYLAACREIGLHTFADLAAHKSYKFVKSWDAPPVRMANVKAAPLRTALKSRSPRRVEEQNELRRRDEGARFARAEYWEAIKSALMDGEITSDEVRALQALQRHPMLTADAIRYVHARVMAGLLEELSSDMKIDDAEVDWIAHSHRLLSVLGWAPGDSVNHPKPASKSPAERLAVSSTKASIDARGGLDRLRDVGNRTWWQRMFG